MRERWTLSAPESLVLRESRPPTDAVLLRAGLIETLLRGHLRISRRQTRGVVGPRSVWLLEPGSATGPTPGALAPFVAALGTARSVTDVDGRPGYRVRAVADALGRRFEGTTYALDILVPRLEEDGLLSVRRRGRRLGVRHVERTTAGMRAAAEAESRITDARRAVQVIGQREDGASRRLAQRDAAAALGTAGALVVLELDLLQAAREIERAFAAQREARASSTAVGPGDASDGEGSAPEDGGPGVGEWPADWSWEVGDLDLDRLVEAVDSGAVSASDFSGSDGGGGGGDGGGSGNGGG